MLEPSNLRVRISERVDYMQTDKKGRQVKINKTEYYL
jgi:hypothetical protein